MALLRDNLHRPRRSVRNVESISFGDCHIAEQASPREAGDVTYHQVPGLI